MQVSGAMMNFLEVFWKKNSKQVEVQSMGPAVKVSSCSFLRVCVCIWWVWQDRYQDMPNAEPQEGLDRFVVGLQCACAVCFCVCFAWGGTLATKAKARK